MVLTSSETLTLGGEVGLVWLAKPSKLVPIYGWESSMGRWSGGTKATSHVYPDIFSSHLDGASHTRTGLMSMHGGICPRPVTKACREHFLSLQCFSYYTLSLLLK